MKQKNKNKKRSSKYELTNKGKRVIKSFAGSLLVMGSIAISGFVITNTSIDYNEEVEVIIENPPQINNSNQNMLYNNQKNICFIEENIEKSNDSLLDEVVFYENTIAKAIAQSVNEIIDERSTKSENIPEAVYIRDIRGTNARIPAFTEIQTHEPANNITANRQVGIGGEDRTQREGSILDLRVPSASISEYEEIETEEMIVPSEPKEIIIDITESPFSNSNEYNNENLTGVFAPDEEVSPEENILSAASIVHRHINENGYSHRVKRSSGALNATSFEQLANVSYINCAEFVSWSLYEAGIGYQEELINSSSRLYYHLSNQDFERITNFDDLQAGDIIFMSSTRSGRGRIGHTQIYAGDGLHFNAGSTNWIQGHEAGEPREHRTARSRFIVALRVPRLYLEAPELSWQENLEVINRLVLKYKD